jgi:two-component system response regulator HydG
VDWLSFMQILITAKAGYTRGASWMLDAKSLVIGRSFRCDIVVDDGTVSRQHCRLQKVFDGVRLEDLGSRNPALVDGVPQEDVVLKVGDEFSVGRAVFLITAVTGAVEPTARRLTDSDTISLDLNDLGLDAIEQGSSWPGTFTDYVLLFRFSRRCSHLKSEAALCAALQEVLTTRFAAARVDLLQECDGLWPVGERLGPADETLIPQAALEKAVEDRRALSFSLPRPGGRLAQLFLAPMFYGDHCEGIAVLTMESLGEDGDREAALRLFSALCELMGPYVHAAREHDSLVQLNHRLASSDGFARMPLVGHSRIMKGLRTQVHEAALTPMNVLITGETGTGKELIARAIHRNSTRSAKPYIILNCAAIPAELFESELFGYERGAFTGAQGAKKGLLAIAHTGILFLDEVGDLSPENQARILRVLEQGTYRRLGAASEEHVDVRFIAATNRPVDDKGFRSDLYHRLAGFTLHAPPLRERAEDIPVLAQHFMDGLAAQDVRLIRTLSQEAVEVLKQYRWPGNVRQLRNTIERIAHRTHTTLVSAEDIWRDGLINKNPDKAAGPLLSLQEMEREHVLKVLRTCGGNRAKAARILEISRSTLYLKLAEYGVEE